MIMQNNIKLETMKNIAKEVGNAVMKIYQKDFTIEYKDEKSPLTEADLKANNC